MEMRHAATSCAVNLMPVTTGHVALASGKSLVNNRIIDWAFVDMNQNSLGLVTPNIMPVIPAAQTPDKYGLRDGTSIVVKLPLDDEFGRLEKYSYYLKVGRTTDITAGLSNGTLSTCKWPNEDRQRYDSEGHEVFVKANRTEEHVIFSKRPRVTEHQQSKFSAPGDSGSVIINQ